MKAIVLLTRAAAKVSSGASDSQSVPPSRPLLAARADSSDAPPSQT